MKYLLLISLIVLAPILACKKNKYSADTVGGRQDSVGNPKPPVADAGTNQVIFFPTTHVILDGSKSSDPNNKPLNYKWKKLAGPEKMQLGNSFYQNPQPAQIEMEVYSVGEYLFELTVSNSFGLSAVSIVKFTVVGYPQTAHTIDMLFDINSFCSITGNFPGKVYYDGANFSMEAFSASGFSGSNTPTNVRVEQEYEKFNPEYFSSPLLTLTEGSNGLITFEFAPSANFFKLPYNAAAASISDSIMISYGAGLFANIRQGTLIYCTATADTSRHASSVRLRGTIYY